jgi:hypothetical protein
MSRAHDFLRPGPRDLKDAVGRILALRPAVVGMAITEGRAAAKSPRPNSPHDATVGHQGGRHLGKSMSCHRPDRSPGAAIGGMKSTQGGQRIRDPAPPRRHRQLAAGGLRTRSASRPRTPGIGDHASRVPPSLRISPAVAPGAGPWWITRVVENLLTCSAYCPSQMVERQTPLLLACALASQTRERRPPYPRTPPTDTRRVRTGRWHRAYHSPHVGAWQARGGRRMRRVGSSYIPGRRFGQVPASRHFRLRFPAQRSCPRPRLRL